MNVSFDKFSSRPPSFVNRLVEREKENAARKYTEGSDYVRAICVLRRQRKGGTKMSEWLNSCQMQTQRFPPQRHFQLARFSCRDTRRQEGKSIFPPVPQTEGQFRPWRDFSPTFQRRKMSHGAKGGLTNQVSIFRCDKVRDGERKVESGE